MADTMVRVERVPPQNTEAEMCVLASMLLDPVGACSIAVDKLREDDFYLPANRLLFNAIADLFVENKPTDIVLLREELDKRGELDKVGGTEYLTTVLESVPTSANIEYYAEIVRDKSVLRKLIEATNEIQRNAYDETENAEGILEQSEQAIFNIAHIKETGSSYAFKDIVTMAVEDIFSDRHGGVETGFSQIDTLTNGFQPGQLIIIAGRPGMGKTTLGLNIVRYAAACKIPTAFYSLEMTATQIVQNIIAAEARVNGGKLRGGAVFNDEEHRRILDSAGRMYDMPLFIDDRPGLTPVSVKARARRLKAGHDIKLLVIDYMQLMESSGRRPMENRQQEISYISRSLKALARDLEIPVIALSQLSRGPESRDNHRPRLSDLRESGAIEQDADIVMLLFREEYYSPENEEVKDMAEINLAKHRNGMTKSKIMLKFESSILRFSEESRLHYSDDDIARSDIAE